MVGAGAWALVGLSRRRGWVRLGGLSLAAFTVLATLAVQVLFLHRETTGSAGSSRCCSAAPPLGVGRDARVAPRRRAGAWRSRCAAARRPRRLRRHDLARARRGHVPGGRAQSRRPAPAASALSPNDPWLRPRAARLRRAPRAARTRFALLTDVRRHRRAATSCSGCKPARSPATAAPIPTLDGPRARAACGARRSALRAARRRVLLARRQRRHRTPCCGLPARSSARTTGTAPDRLRRTALVLFDCGPGARAREGVAASRSGRPRPRRARAAQAPPPRARARGGTRARTARARGSAAQRGTADSPSAISRSCDLAVVELDVGAAHELVARALEILGEAQQHRAAVEALDVALAEQRRQRARARACPCGGSARPAR